MRINLGIQLANKQTHVYTPEDIALVLDGKMGVGDEVRVAMVKYVNEFGDGKEDPVVCLKRLMREHLVFMKQIDDAGE